MAKKITKAQWDKCLADEIAWEGKCMDETVLKINGSEVSEVDPSLPPETIIYIVEGIVATLELEYVKSLSSFITAWEKKQAVRTLAIEVPRDLNDKTLREHLKAVGARLL